MYVCLQNDKSKMYVCETERVHLFEDCVGVFKCTKVESEVFPVTVNGSYMILVSIQDPNFSHSAP